MDAGERPIFFDQSGRRKRRFTLAILAFVALLVLAISVFATSIAEVVPQQALPFSPERAPIHGVRGPVGALAHDAKRRFRHAIRNAAWMLPGFAPSKPTTPDALTIAFHAPWDDASAASLQRHINDIDWLMPAWMSITGPRFTFTVFPDVRGHTILAQASHRPKLLPVIQNALNGDWDAKNASALLHDPASRKRFLDVIEVQLVRQHADGACFDLEDLPPSAQADYLAFLREANTRFDKHGWLIAVAVPVGNEDWNLKAYAAIVDRIIVMAYDEHYPGGDPGPIASQGWFVQNVGRAIAGVPRDKIVIALGSYAYDWSKGDTEALSVEESWLRAHESETIPQFDRASANSAYSYDEQGVHHEVWIEDAAAFSNQQAAMRAAGIDAFALWRLGTEDPSIWSLFGRAHRVAPNPAAIERIPAGTDVDIEGTGEILRVGSEPVPGFRTISIDRRGLIVDLNFTRLPLPYTIERAGYRPKMVALTFDDGPDAHFTPRILDVLRDRHVPATFFIIGENALTNRGLLNRLVAEGHEVGNHTYTHPNLGRMSEGPTDLELNATQRLFQAFTGRSLRLFRAPYFGDAEPTTADEIDAVWRAQKLGYLSVGLHVDPDDWKRPGVAHIVQETIDGVEASDADRSGNVVLLHDAGGDRQQTVAALPIIIDQLRARGYSFVPVSTLIGLPRDAVMPQIAASDRLAARADLALFSTLGFSVEALGWLFTLAISIGIARSVLLSALALLQARREARERFPAIDPDRFVSVLIPAYNEARVIERSVAQVLASRDVRLEVIVIDDGSKDGTGEIVRTAFANEPRVRLLSLENGGKARALNQGLALAGGEIVIALDADTQFEPPTIARLARWFVDPTLGAVAGNAKVGNRVNLITRWQALEYVTAQNLERRALARLGAMTVVPGAVGAWRAETLRQVGGYPHDTLAEDQDLTIAIQRAGWHVRYDQYAIAWTEAPESVAGLAKQRFRWAFGTLQCLWKHRAVIGRGRPRGLALVGLPQAILFQIGFAAVSPVIDLALVVSILATGISVHEHGWAATQTDLAKMLIYWTLFTLIDLLSGVIAFALERREHWRLLPLMITQRIGYRQIMYYVVLKALAQALRGPRVGWGKLERSGRVGT